MKPLDLLAIDQHAPFIQYIRKVGNRHFNVVESPTDRYGIALHAVNSHEITSKLLNLINANPHLGKALESGAPLLLDCCTEGPAFHRPTWEAIHSVLEAVGMRSSQVTYISNNHSFNGAYYKWISDTKLESINVLQYNIFFRAVANGMRQRILQRSDRKEVIESIFPFSGKKVSRFLCLNHRLRGHRLVVLGRIVRLGVFDKGYVSVLGGDSDKGSVSLEASLRSAFEMFPRFGRDLEAFKSIADQIPIRIAADSSGNHISSISLPMYSQTWFSLVNETEMTLGGVRRFTEKSVKPLLAGHPTLVAGNPGTLSLLKSYGFETFSSCIDEAYDMIANREDRLEAVLDDLSG